MLFPCNQICQPVAEETHQHCDTTDVDLQSGRQERQRAAKLSSTLPGHTLGNWDLHQQNQPHTYQNHYIQIHKI
jgi:hypothetical protein